MYVFLTVIHVMTAFVMIGSILLQSGKGAEIGATFGGSSQTIFGGRGATTFLAKFTAICAVIFAVTSLSLAVLSKERSLGTSLKLPPAPTAPASAPTDPAAAPTSPAAEPSGTPAPPAPAVPPTPPPATP
jgi:preprotein translocase subunit SecG